MRFFLIIISFFAFVGALSMAFYYRAYVQNSVCEWQPVPVAVKPEIVQPKPIVIVKDLPDRSKEALHHQNKAHLYNAIQDNQRTKDTLAKTQQLWGEMLAWTESRLKVLENTSNTPLIAMYMCLHEHCVANHAIHKTHVNSLDNISQDIHRRFQEMK